MYICNVRARACVCVRVRAFVARYLSKGNQSFTDNIIVLNIFSLLRTWHC